MIKIRDSIAGESLNFYCAESKQDASEIARTAEKQVIWALDTESTGLNVYHPQWSLRTFQFGNDRVSYVLPAKFKEMIFKIIMLPGIQWIGHNGPHDIRSLDVHLGLETGVVCRHETYIPAHHADSRNRDEGGIGHGLKDLAIALVDPYAGKWELALKKAFKEIDIPLPGEVYKSGPRKGLPKTRKAKYAEGWSLIDPFHPAYVAYAASDPVLTYRVRRKLSTVVKEFRDLYDFDHRVQMACDRLQRRGLPLDVPYAEKLVAAYTRKAERYAARAAELGCQNIYSGQQIADALLVLGAELTERTPTGKLSTKDYVLRKLLAESTGDIHRLLRSILLAKQLTKRRDAHVQAMLDERDANDRVHPSINTLGARTARMSVSNPPLHQLPTKDTTAEETA